MKSIQSKLLGGCLTLCLSLLAVLPAAGAEKASSKKINVSEDVDSLGGNADIMKMAQSLKSESRARVVQDRVVDRKNRFELGLGYGGVVGGDSYLRTQGLNVAADFHFTPRWSVGVHHYDFSNSLTSEGQRVFDQARKDRAAGNTAQLVDIDYPLNATMAFVNWYPIYGKTSFMDAGITQFDIYFLAGGGRIQLSSGSTGIYAAGLGLGAWISQSVSLRAELKYQTYRDQVITGNRTLNTVAANIGLGWML